MLLADAMAAGPASSPIGLLVGTVVGALLRVLIARFTGPDPRPPRVWVAELVVIGVAAGAFALMPAAAWATSGFGAGITTYAGAAGAFGFLGAQRVKANPWVYGVGHFCAVLICATAVFVGVILIVRAVS